MKAAWKPAFRADRRVGMWDFRAQRVPFLFSPVSWRIHYARHSGSDAKLAYVRTYGLYSALLRITAMCTNLSVGTMVPLVLAGAAGCRRSVDKFFARTNTSLIHSQMYPAFV